MNYVKHEFWSLKQREPTRAIFAGWEGVGCDRPCELGRYGANCSETCLNLCRNGGECNPKDGTCMCTSGFTGANCSTVCSRGTYGIGCSNECAVYCPLVRNTQWYSCDSKSGTCNCKKNRKGKYILITLRVSNQKI
jgi:multiple epidermal growth factor-like domains protein 10/11